MRQNDKFTEINAGVEICTVRKMYNRPCKDCIYYKTEMCLEIQAEKDKRQAKLARRRKK